MSKSLNQKACVICMYDAKDEQEGAVNLPGIVDSKSVEVTWHGEPIEPKGYSIYGEPYFGQAFVEEYLKDLKSRKETIKDLVVSYANVEFDVPEEKYNSMQAVQDSLTSYASFRALVENRLKSVRATNRPLEKFVVLNTYVLDEKGHVCLIYNQNAAPQKEVYTYEEYRKYSNGEILYYLPIPFSTRQEKCEYCNKEFTIEDLQDKKLLFLNTKTLHKECKK